MKLTKQISRFTKKHAPEILTGLGVIGTVGTAVLTGTGTVKALNILMDEEQDRAVIFETEGVNLPWNTTEKIKVVWPCYVPAVMVGLGTIACIIGSGAVNHKRQVSLASAYAMLNTSFNEYRAKNIELFGAGTDVKVRDSVTEDHYKKSAKDGPVDGKILFCEEVSNWFFDATMAEVIDAEMQINKRMCEDGEAALNEFYEFLGIPTQDFGEELGWEHWAVASMNGGSWLDFTHRLCRLDDGSEYYVIECNSKPYAFNYPNEENDIPFL